MSNGQTRRTSRTPAAERAIVACLFVLGLAVGGCRGMVGVRATVLDEPTRLERQVLGERAVLAPGAVLLPLKVAAGRDLTRQELIALDDGCAAELAALVSVEPQTADTRTWSAIILHNRAILQARLGDTERAADVLSTLAKHCEAYGLDVLRWQALHTLGELRGGEAGYALRLQAAEVLAKAALTSEFEYQLEDPERRDALYAGLIGASLTKKDAEAALEFALQRRAVALARACAPGSIAFPPGDLAKAAGELAAARKDVARARKGLSIFGVDVLLSGKAAAAQQRFKEARKSLDAAADRFRKQHPAAAGLLVPAPADAFALQELLWPDTAMLIVERVGGGEFAAFLLKADVFEARRFKVQDGKSVPEAVGAQVLTAFAKHLAKPVERLYLVPPAGMGSLDWEALPVSAGPTLGERYQVALLTDPADLVAAFAQKGYGRETYLLSRGAAKGLDEVGAELPKQAGVTALDAATSDRSLLMAAMGYPDFVWLSNPVVRDATEPGRSYVRIPSALGRLGGVDVGALCSLGSRASCVGLAQVSGEGETDVPLRVLLRAMAAGGVPTVIYAGEGVPAKVNRAFWDDCLARLREVPAGEAYRRSLANVPAQWRGHFRLYGFAGMNEAEYAEFSKLELADQLRASQADMKAGRLKDAAARLLDLWHMVDALEVNRPDEKLRMLANTQALLIDCWGGLREYEKAAYHEELRIGYLKQLPDFPPSTLGLEYQSLGALLTKAERFDDAVAAYRTSMELLEKDKDIAKALSQLATSYDYAAQYDEALASFGAALKKYEEMKDQSGAARQLQQMGALSLRRLNLPHRAEAYFEKALGLYEAQGDLAGVAGTTVDIGLCRRHVGDFEEAVKRFDSALAAARENKLAPQEARALSELAGTRWFEGNYQEAFQLVTASNEIAVQAEDAFRLNVNYQLLGLIYWELNDFDRAHAELETAMAQARLAEAPLEVASACNNRGIVFRRQGKHLDAINFFLRALQIDRRLGSRWGQGYDHRNIGITLQRMGRYEEAGDHLTKAVELSEAIEDAVNLAKALYYLGELRLAQGRLDEAQPLIERALASARKVYLPEVEWRALRSLGLLHKAKGDQAGALEVLEEAVKVVEELRGGLKIEEFRSGFLTNKMDLYEDVVALLLEMERSEEAFSYAERSRARNFLDILAGQAFDLHTDRERELYAQQQRIAREIRALREAAAREGDEAQRKVLLTRLAELRKQYTDTLTLIRAANPELASFVTVEVATPADLLKVLPPKVALITYYVMDGEVAIWVLRDGKMQLRRVKVEREQLSSAIRDYRVMVQRRELIEKVRTAAQGLNDLLIAPVADLLEGSEVVGIVPHRALHYLSFASLHDGQAFLVERYPLFYVPSASVLPHTLKGEPKWRQEGPLKVLAIGNPEVGNPAYALPFSEKEVKSLMRDFVEVTNLLGGSATEAWVREHIAEFDVIHFAAHAYFDGVNPLFSALMLTAGGGDDGLLELHEVGGLRINAYLVTLSACQSGVGQLKAADELVSLSRAFMYAGTPSILSTLWRVDDVSTALLAKHFYRHHAGHRVPAVEGEREAATGRGRAASLRYAQLQVMNDGKHYHPMYWAGMILTGDYR